MAKKLTNNTSSEILAAFLDGNATSQESQAILDSLSEDAQLRELLHISQLVDSEVGYISEDYEYLPMAAMAASCDEGAYCCLECEKYIFNQFGVAFDANQLMDDAVKNGWYKEDGTALHNVGRHLEKCGFGVIRTYHASLGDIMDALKNDEKVIVAVDGGELSGNAAEELMEDILEGEMPDHTVVVLAADEESVTVYNPDSLNAIDVYPQNVFADAWADSKNYMVTISKEMHPYNPKPIDLSDVVLSEDLNDLREAIAENAHDVWAVERKAQGWTYGPQRDDAKKETPCMVAYSQLPDSEKKFDREMAMNTLKLLLKLGYEIKKK